MIKTRYECRVFKTRVVQERIDYGVIQSVEKEDNYTLVGESMQDILSQVSSLIYSKSYRTLRFGKLTKITQEQIDFLSYISMTWTDDT